MALWKSQRTEPVKCQPVRATKLRDACTLSCCSTASGTISGIDATNGGVHRGNASVANRRTWRQWGEAGKPNPAEYRHRRTEIAGKVAGVWISFEIDRAATRVLADHGATERAAEFLANWGSDMISLRFPWSSYHLKAHSSCNMVRGRWHAMR